jgi:hypothetical protein
MNINRKNQIEIQEFEPISFDNNFVSQKLRSLSSSLPLPLPSKESFPQVSLDTFKRFEVYESIGQNLDSIAQKIRSASSQLSAQLPQLPQLPQFPQFPQLPQVPVSLTLESLKKLEVYEYLLRTLQHLIFLFNTLSFFSSNLNLNLTTQINSTISNFSCFVNQIMEIISYSNKKSWDELKEAVNDIRKKFSTLECNSPSNISFRELADGRVRIYFLNSQYKYHSLLYVDVKPGSTADPSL